MYTDNAEPPTTNSTETAPKRRNWSQWTTQSTTLNDLWAALKPTHKWHYLFHILVVAIACSYWIGSLVKLPPEVSWAEIAMYRPRGDNQVYPVIAALSNLNFGDPTDSIHHGKGSAVAQVVVLFPYALAYALFGVPGYMVADALLTWVYFIVLLLFLRRCGFGNFSSLMIATLVATRSLQLLCTKLGEALGALLSVSKLAGTWEWGFPNLLDLHLFVQRIPRPMGTELFVVLLLYYLLRQWQDQERPLLRRGFVIGALFALLLQGDPFTLSALGLVLLFVLAWPIIRRRGSVPWQYMAGGIVGAASFGAYFLWQQFSLHPDTAARFGLADYPRNKIMFLPGYAPLLRVGVVCALAFLVILAARRSARSPLAGNAEPKGKSRRSKATTRDIVTSATQHEPQPIEQSVAIFIVAVILAGWLAQPLQLLLLGKGSQIYHYLIFTLPTLYSYGVLVLGFTFIKLATAPELSTLVRRLGDRPQWTGATAILFVFGLAGLVGMENKVVTVSSMTNARQETNVPWYQGGELYRPSLRAVEKQFRENPQLKDVRSFATLCYELNFLLAGFYEKRAYLPDNAYSTLSDAELEDRLCEFMKLLQVPRGHFLDFAQANFILNYWLGCAKYWMTSDYQYSTLDDYTPEQLADLRAQAKQSPWLLCLPKSEAVRLSQKYDETVARPSDHSVAPDAIIVGLEKTLGLLPDPDLYREVYTNELFSIYTKNKAPNVGNAEPKLSAILGSHPTP